MFLCKIQKPACILLLLLLLPGLLACGGAEEATLSAKVSVQQETFTPEPVAETAQVTVVPLTPAPTATPQPTPSPTPTPTPTPSPTPTPRDHEAMLSDSYHSKEPETDERYTVLFGDRDNLPLVAMKGSSIKLFEDTTLEEYEEVSNTTTYRKIKELIVLDTAEDADGNTLYYVMTAFDGRKGYVRAANTEASSLISQGEVSGFALMCRPGVAVLKEPDSEKECELLDQVSYGLCRILGGYNDQFVYILDENGVFGFVDRAQLQSLTFEETKALLSKTDLSGTFSLESLTTELEGQVGLPAADTESLLYEGLSRYGLCFDPGYYLYFTKDLNNDTLYPRFYKSDVYNSLLFKLFNTSGELVLYRGNPTQWAYVGSIEELQRGDIVFFSDTEGETAIQPNVEVVYRGKYSGYITGCGLYLGEDRLLMVKEGYITIVEDFGDSVLGSTFDCARRIIPYVEDYTCYLQETLLSYIYDRLGTPYNNIRRTGDGSYDCSGIVCWSMRSVGLNDKAGKNTLMTERTAAGLSNVKSLYWEKMEKTVTFTPLSKFVRTADDMKQLQRGDLIFLVSGSNNKIGHVMFYLGNDFIIHSTTISGQYRGTLVAGFRQALKNKYYYTLRMTVE